MSEHTKEPWEVRLASSDYVYIGDGERVVGKIYTPSSRDVIYGTGLNNAIRIVSCVNACADMQDPETEIEKLRSDREELLEAFKELVNECLNEFVHIPEHRRTAEEYYWEELALIKRMEDKNAR